MILIILHVYVKSHNSPPSAIEIAEVPGDASMPEQVKRPNPCRMMMMTMSAIVQKKIGPEIYCTLLASPLKHY
jgi:hypothetical protein